MNIYLAGPMTGYPQFNFPAFMAAAKKLRAQGRTVFNPAENDMEVHGEDFGKDNDTGDVALAEETAGFSLRDALKTDLSWICDNADGIAMLPGWEDSKGAKAEHALAYALGLEMYYM